MKTNAELMLSLQQEINYLIPLAKAGDDDAFVKLAMGKSIYKYLQGGHKLNDLDWFKYTPYYSYSPAADLKQAA